MYISVRFDDHEKSVDVCSKRRFAHERTSQLLHHIIAATVHTTRLSAAVYVA